MKTANLLRERLDEITCRDKASVDSHPKLIADLAAEIQHSIERAPDAPCVPITRYNCFEFALGLVGCREVRLISYYLPSTFCNGSFAQYLVDSILIPAVAPSSDDLVFYHDTHQITHAGVVAADRIISKWGTGHLWLHRLIEVPASYGNTTSFYAGITPQDALVNFVEFARQREGRELVDYVLELEPIEWCEPLNTVLQQSDLAGR